MLAAALARHVAAAVLAVVLAALQVVSAVHEGKTIAAFNESSPSVAVQASAILGYFFHVCMMCVGGMFLDMNV